MIEIIDPRTGEMMDTDSVPGLASVALLQQEQIYQLSGLVAQLQEGSVSADESSGSTGPYVWGSLTAAEEEALWLQLAEWVGWVRGRYPIARQIPRCWWRHPELVEELTALWLAWREAYTEKGAPLTAAADWHGRWLPELLRRVGAGGWNIACEAEHKERIQSLYDATAVDDQEAFHDFVGRGLVDNERPGQGGVPEKPSSSEEHTMDDDAMQAAVESGTARRLGDLPDSPVALGGVYWVRGDTGWSEVQDQDTIALLADADRRMRLADEAIANAKQG